MTEIVQLTPEQVIEAVEKGLAEDGGHLSISYSPEDKSGRKWLAGAEWGREAPDSPMAGAAAYQTGETLQEALSALVDEAGWLR